MDEVHDAVFVDGIHLGCKAVVLIAQNEKHVLGWYVARNENSRAWAALMERIAPPRLVVADGGGGFEKARKKVWPNTRTQRCTFHVFGQITRATTLRPRLEASKELYRLGTSLLRVCDAEEAHAWVQAYTDWCLRWETFLAEKTSRDGGGWEYTHERLVRARSSLNRLVSAGVLFTFVDPAWDRQMPAMNNRIEGATNAPLRQVLRDHWGMRLTRRIKAVFWWCYTHSEQPLPAAQILKIMPTDAQIEAAWHLVGATFQAGQLVIIDEASLTGTLSLDRITQAAAEAGAKVLLVGDYAQLQSVDAGGAFSLLIHDRDDAPELVDVHRLSHAWEKTASLELRHGRTPVIDTYLAHERIHEGDAEAMTDAAYTAWRHDRQQGLASVLIAETRENVTALNVRARADLILDDTLKPGPEITLSDGPRAGVGDTIITLHNDRRLRNRHGWVRNGQTWTITAVRDDGSVTIRPPGARFGNSIVLPADYVLEHVDLSYAVTAHRAQGITTDTAHVLVLVEPTTTRENLYVAMTRGRESNQAYVILDRPDDHAMSHPGDNPDATARTVLYGLLQHSGAELSAHETITAEQDRWGSIAQLAAAAQHDRWTTLVRGSGLTDEQAQAVIESDAFGALTAELAGPKPTTTTSTPSCHASSRLVGSPPPTTSPPSSTIASPTPPPNLPAPVAPASHRVSSSD